MHRITALLLAAFTLGFAPAPFLAPRPGRAGDDLKSLQGEWTMTACTSGGANIPLPGPRGAVFIGGRLEVIVDGALFSRWKVTLNSGRSPGVLSLVGEASPAVYAGRVLRGCYRLEGDSLTIAYGGARWDTQPADTRPGPGVTVHVYKRKKP